MPIEAIGLVVVAVGLVFVVLIGLKRWHEAKNRHSEWRPALTTDDPKKDVHVLGSRYPQKSRDFLASTVSNAYTVPKDPEEYAKIFVPTKDRKGSAE
ncbi:MAG: hypothetical protein U1A24_19200 [Cypionkella sp.]|uniref:hypothetical protein n=1 Tax=Cypionkella sp. TaxID=2811411 RepID=UPI002ABA0A9B|nr:hypothetical protein [Cypionkella sp.]MDZ4312679.1 hypothetical protein [Cypionkella sp.]